MITVNDLKNRDNFFLMAGPCAIEGEDMALRIAEKVVGITNKLNIPYTGKPTVLGWILSQALAMRKH